MAKNRIAVVGGGAAGLAAAITAARLGADVTVLEHMERVGKKLLSTGNGRCNFTHEGVSAEAYFSDCPETLSSLLERYPTQRLLDFMEEIGVVPVCRDGYYYPASNQAAAVLDCLRAECEYQGVHFRCGCSVQEIRPFKGGYLLSMEENEEFFARVILACGGQAAPFTGSDGNGYKLAAALGHRLIPVFPALTGLTAVGRGLKGLAGVRAAARASLFINGHFLAAHSGEVQFADNSLSGIVIFQLSHQAAESLLAGKKTEIRLNFLPELSKKQALSFLDARRVRLEHKSMEEWGIGLFPRKLWEQIRKNAAIEAGRLAGELTQEEVSRLYQTITVFRVQIDGFFGFERAQATAGGVSLQEVQADTLESRRMPGLYFAGEILNVDGLCGGYNLHWAFASGMAAGEAAAFA